MELGGKASTFASMTCSNFEPVLATLRMAHRRSSSAKQAPSSAGELQKGMYFKFPTNISKRSGVLISVAAILGFQLDEDAIDKAAESSRIAMPSDTIPAGSSRDDIMSCSQ